MAKDKQIYPGVALTAAGLCISFVIFVFVYGDLRKEPFVQGASGILIALAIAVVLFSAVPGSAAKIKLPIGLAGAAAFYFLLLPRIESFIFPFHSFAGYVAYESKSTIDKGYDPVEGAEVEISGTSMSAKTDAKGKFVIPDVPSQVNVTDLIVSRGGRSYRVKIKDYPDNIYRIPREPQVIQSSKRSVRPEEWSAERAECATVGEKKLYDIRQFSLHKAVLKEDGYSNMVMDIKAGEGVEILKARKLAPQEGFKVQPDGEYSKQQKWLVPIGGEETKLHLLMCVGADKRELKISNSSINASYWFEKVE